MTTYFLIDPYVEGLTAATSHEQLMRHLEAYKDVAPDALKDAPGYAEFEWFRNGLLAERAGLFAGQEWQDRFTRVLIPERMLRDALEANRAV